MTGTSVRVFREYWDVPFYLHMGFSDPHRDFGNRQGYPDYDEVTYDPGEVPVPDFCRTTPMCGRSSLNIISRFPSLDAGFGRAIQALEEAGRA